MGRTVNVPVERIILNVLLCAGPARVFPASTIKNAKEAMIDTLNNVIWNKIVLSYSPYRYFKMVYSLHFHIPIAPFALLHHCVVCIVTL